MPDQSAHGHPPRICHGCHQDCSHKARLKDPAGHYWCKECFEKADALEKERAAHARPHAHATPAPPAAPQPLGDEPLDLREDVATTACIACQSPVAAGLDFCALCGAAQRPTSASASAAPVAKGRKPPKVAKAIRSRNLSQRILRADEFAGFWRRFAGSLIDAIILAIFFGIVGGVVGAMSVASGAITGPDDPFVLPTWLSIVAPLVPLVYGTLFEGIGGATPGKAALGMIVGGTDSNELGLLGAFARNMTKSFISGPLFFISIAGLGIIRAGDNVYIIVIGVVLVVVGLVPYALNIFTPKRQTLHDLLSGAMVVH
ncbi:MAG: RDD family protein [Phycisphaerales bacterium]